MKSEYNCAHPQSTSGDVFFRAVRKQMLTAENDCGTTLRVPEPAIAECNQRGRRLPSFGQQGKNVKCLEHRYEEETCHLALFVVRHNVLNRKGFFFSHQLVHLQRPCTISEG